MRFQNSPASQSVSNRYGVVRWLKESTTYTDGNLKLEMV